MIQELSARFQKGTATLLSMICFNGMILPSHAFGNARNYSPAYVNVGAPSLHKAAKGFYGPGDHLENFAGKSVSVDKNSNAAALKNKPAALKPDIGGPSQPEMSAFKSVGTDNMVNLFTGDFSYNIPLLDVGGYPVNIFYDGGVSMEQEASWVGLGWNINPGNVNRNMRGVPDDFNGEEVLTQKQNMKPNITWGAKLGADIELVGKKLPFKGKAGASIGVSFNNYLGPALDIGIRGNTGLSILSKSLPEKCALTLGGSLSINASSRSGVTFSPGLSLSADMFSADKKNSAGFGLKAATSYNSRSGIKEIQIAEQMSFSHKEAKVNKVPGGFEGRVFKSSIGENIASSSISFTKPSYIPSIRIPVTSTAFSGHFQWGGGIFGVEGDEETEVYQQTSFVAAEDIEQKKPMVGYLYLQNANGNQNTVLDFTRVNDNEVTPNTPIISAPQYSYDVFSIQGEGTGGSIRAYRNDDGYARDKYTLSKDKSISIGADADPPGHYGGNFSIVKTPSVITEWTAGNKLKNSMGFKGPKESWENVYFRNPGESGVLNNNEYDRIGGLDLVRYKLGGSNVSPTIEPVLERFQKSGQKISDVNMLSITSPSERKKRTQVINFLNADEASIIGLDKTIRSYNRTTVLNNLHNLNYDEFPRVDDTHKGHHISQINVTEANGQRYIYGIPVYNIVQKDFTFTVNSPADLSDPDKVTFLAAEAENVNTGVQKDGYIQKTTTPPYAHSFLLSGLLSPDYVDVGNDGITENDLGNAVKFNYTKMSNSKWRTPLTDGLSNLKANFSDGKRTETKDDKGMVSYGERESWYVHSIESKTMIALFTLESRHDNKGSLTELGGINGADQSAQRLQKIDLYNKADLKKNGLTGTNAAKPIKTVHFEYDYNLCVGTPNNVTANEGKLTLKKVWFTFNGQSRNNKNQYVFSYGGGGDNPQYTFNGSDRWGTYKNPSNNPLPLRNADYPYSLQDKSIKATIDQNAGAWMLKKILLPSGGQMEVTYESDDYAFVQNKRAAVMMPVLGFGEMSNSIITNQLYNITPLKVKEYDYAFIQVPEACVSDDEVYQKYLSGIDQLSFKIAIKMPGGKTEPINAYALITAKNCGLYSGDASHKTIWVKMNEVDDKSPLSLTAIEFLREQLPGQAYEGYNVTESQGLQQVALMMKGWLQGLGSAFTNPVDFLRGSGKAQIIEANKSFVRLNDPDGFKYGGGYRVKSLRLKDNWKEMNSGNSYTSEYGQDYDYTTNEVFNGVQRSISSGVASYEPSLGGDENPFQTMVQISNKVPLGPTSYGAVEMPVLDAFFPAPLVGYSKVTVTSIKKGAQDPNKKSRSGIGKQVTQFYTAKDFPVYYNNTPLDPSADKQANTDASLAFFYKYAFDSRALSQGFLVETNDMHGKMKSQASYPENDDKTLINYTENFYRNTGSKGLDEKFDFVHADQQGIVAGGNQGIDAELMTDTREFSVKSKSLEIQGQADMFPVLFPGLPWLPFVWPVAGNNENTYRAVTTTKVITYHSILDSVSVLDKGSQVGTKNLVFDSETGDVIVNRTNNEFKQPIYSTNYPAWWGYSGMGQAYKNIDAVYTGVNFRNGKISNGAVPVSILESGDEVYVIKQKDLTTIPHLTGVITYSKAAHIPGGGCGDRVILTFTFNIPTPRAFRLYFGKIETGLTSAFWPYMSYGCNEFSFPTWAHCTDFSPFVIDIPAGVTNYVTPTWIPTLETSQSWTNCAEHENLRDIYCKEAIIATDFYLNLSLSNPNINFHYDNPTTSADCITSSPDAVKLWVFNTHKNTGSLTDVAPDYYFMDADGKLFTKDNVSFRIVRSGKRNMLNASAASVVSMNTPVVNNYLKIDNTSKATSATAVRYKEKWKNDKEVFKKYSLYTPPGAGNLVVNGNFENGNTGFTSYPNGNYHVGPIPAAWNSHMSASCRDHTTANTNMLMLDGANSTGHLAYVAQTITVTPYTNYQFITWIQEISNSSPAQLIFYINSVQIGGPYPVAGVCAWQAWGHNWNSGNSTSATIAIYDANDDVGGNDFALDDISFTKLDPETPVEVFDCNGYLEKNLNPYCRGLLGNFRADQSMVFYHDRTELSPQQPTNVPANGFLAGFTPYWNFNSQSNLVPDEANTKWVWNSRVNKYNSRGMELETKDALKIYTAAQYGFSNTMPVSIVNNSAYGESVSEGFEDAQYDGTLNLNSVTCKEKYFNLNGISNSAITTQALTGIKPHSGSYMMAVNTGFTAQKELTVSDFADNDTDFDLSFGLATCGAKLPVAANTDMLNPVFKLHSKTRMFFSAWVKESCGSSSVPCTLLTYTNIEVTLDFGAGTSVSLIPVGPIIEGWQKIEGSFDVPEGISSAKVNFINTSEQPVYFDDIRIHPFNANMKTYVYDPINLRLLAEADANNYSSFYEYDDEGTLIRTKAETKEGIKTITETRSAKQKDIINVIE
jgi:hypothetical protein